MTKIMNEPKVMVQKITANTVKNLQEKALKLSTYHILQIFL